MKSLLRILHLEDSPQDAEVIQENLDRNGLECELVLVTGRETFTKALGDGSYDLILSDYGLCDWDGLSALEQARQILPEVPFILVSGTLGEEQAVESLQRGATDYILKNRLTRLAPAVHRALQESKKRAELKQAEEAMSQSEYKYRHLFESLSDAAFLVEERRGQIIDTNPQAERLLGLPREHILGRRLDSFHPANRVEEHLRRTSALPPGGGPANYESEITSKDGRTVPVHISAAPIQLYQTKLYLALYRDITGIKQVEEARRASEERFQVALKNSSILVFNQDRDLRYRWIHNPRSGFPREEMLGKTDEELLSPTDAARLTQIKQRVLQSGVGAREEVQITSGEKTFYYDLTIEPLRDGAGESIGLTGSALDITEKKAAEAQFLRAQRLESIGALASGIAHDMNNILAPILMSAPMLRWGLKPEEIERTALSIETTAQRGADLVKQLLLFGRGVEGHRTLLQPKYLIRDIVKMIRETFPKALTVEARTTADLWLLTGDATQLHQVLLNLCVNARDAMPTGGRLSIGAENVRLDEQYAGMTPEAKSGPYVLLRVADTGEGIPERVMDKIFDPFFTTKEQGRGTGLGLSTALGIVKSHGGFLDVRSEVGKGTTFSVYLPAAPDETMLPEDAGARADPAKGRGQLILVVDDEPEILRITEKNLSRNGYQTLVAKDGIEALVTFTQRREEINAVLVDLEMPLMDGVTLVRAIRKVSPTVPVIASSGIGSGQGLAEKTGQLKELGVDNFLTKPYGADALFHVLQEAFGKS